MAGRIVKEGTHWGLDYLLVEVDGKFYVALDKVEELTASGADAKLLSNVGREGAEKAIEAFIRSVGRS